MGSPLKFGLWLAGGIVFGGLMTGCRPDPAQRLNMTADAFLRRTMDHYQHLAAYRADTEVTRTTGNQTATEKRQFRYLAPNRFRLVAELGPKMVFTSASDGKDHVEFADDPGIQAAKYPAPTTLGAASSMLLDNSTFGGSLLYAFFGGAANFDAVVDPAKMPVVFGDESAEGGETAIEVKFYSPRAYGHVAMLIGETSHNVYRIAYDAEPQMLAQTKESRVVTPTESVETFRNISTDAQFPADTFSTQLPKGVKVGEPSVSGTNHPPVEFGQPAPDITVQDLAGKNVKLSALRGNVVLLDFWATWCPPCREGLPETARLAQEGKSKGLRVLAITGEDAAPIQAFLQKQTYRLSPYRDPGGVAAGAYNADAIPTTVIVDAKGNLSAYMVGLQSPDDLRRALAKAGARL